MSTKKQNQLSLVEKDILARYGRNKPVLLYGNSDLDLEELIERIKIAFVEIQIEQNPSLKEYYKSGYEPLGLIKYIDCGGMDGKEVYETLAGCSSLEVGLLIEEHGILIIDNLHCVSEEDKKDYRKLGKIIKDRQIEHSPTTFNWLVAYTNDPEPFPSYFKEQFDLILLDGDLKNSFQISRRIALRHIGKESIAEVESKDEYIFRKDGERWYIKFENEVLKPENLDGFKYIHYLMLHTNKKLITPKKLYQAVKGITASNKDEDNSLKTYSLQSKTIDNAQHGELKEHHSNSEMIQLENELIKMNKNEIKKIVEILKKDKETLINRKKEFEEDGIFSESDDIEKEIKEVREKIDLATRKEHNPEHKQFYDLVYKAIEKAKEKIKMLSIKNNYDSLLTWNYCEDSIVYNDFHYSYKPTTSINWKL